MGENKRETGEFQREIFSPAVEHDYIWCYQSSEKLFVELFKMPPKAKRLTRKEAAVLRDKERVEEEWRKIKRTEEMLKVLDLPEFPK